MILSSLTLLAALAADGPAHVTVDLLRPSPTAPRVFVEVAFADGSTGLMMVDTGADITVLTRTTAQRLQLAPGQPGTTLQGLSQAAQVDVSALSTLRIGEATLHDVRVAIGLPGVQDTWGAMPVAGILGNNVWSEFIVDLDLHANRLTLHQPGSFRAPRGAAPLRFDGAHLQTPVLLRTDLAGGVAVLAVDTGASDVLLIGEGALPFDGAWTEGVEPIRGVTTPDALPDASYLRETRRVALRAVDLGGARRRVHTDARWLDYDLPAADPRLAGLVGYEALQNRRVILDYQRGWFSLQVSHRPAGFTHGCAVLLREDEARFGDDPRRWLYRSRLLLGLDQQARARGLLGELLEISDPDVAPLHAAARALAAAIDRGRGDLDGAWNLLAPLSPAELVEQEEIVAVVDGLLLEGRTDEAGDVSAAAVATRPASPLAWVARADVLLARGDPDDAYTALGEATRLVNTPDAWLLRRARVAWARGDHNGALALLRDGLRSNPLDGRLAFFYATLAPKTDRDTVRSDLQGVLSRLHPSLRPNDLLAGAFVAIGDLDRARTLYDEGTASDCASAQRSPSADHCYAWFEALAHTDLDDALARISRAISALGPRADLYDTLAMVLLARGELQAAHSAALTAARMAPDDAYLLWQAERIGALAGSP